MSMTMARYFSEFCNLIAPTSDEASKWNNRIDRIGKRLNIRYYDLWDCKEHVVIVGSVGRGTATGNISDYDCIFELPAEKFKQYDSYSSNGQSALLQEIKEEIKLTFPNTDIRGDGQVVVISFKDGKIELVPAFRQKDSSFKYPDSHNDGSWKITKPLPEIREAGRMSAVTDLHYVNFCRIARKWKNKIGFKFKGLLIDTVTKEFFDESDKRLELKFSDYYQEFINFLDFLSEKDSKCSYWHALGSNQEIINDDNGKFIKEAKSAYDSLKGLEEDSDEAIAMLNKLLGNEFRKLAALRSAQFGIQKAENEEFVEDRFIVDVRYNLKIDCDIKQDGFRTKKLSSFLKNKKKLKNRAFYN